MRCVWALGVVFAVGCQPPAGSGSRTVLEVYRHPNGVSNCVDSDKKGVWKADESCCPEGFEVVGFSAPAAFEYLKEIEKDGEVTEKETRRIFRHVVCMEKARKPATRPE